MANWKFNLLKNFERLFEELTQSVFGQVCELILEEHLGDLIDRWPELEETKKGVLHKYFYFSLRRGYGIHFFIHYKQPHHLCFTAGQR